MPTYVTSVDQESGGVLRVDFASEEPASLAVSLAGDEQHLDVDGSGSAYFVLPEQAGDVSLAAEPSDVTCVASVTVGPAWVAEE